VHTRGNFVPEPIRLFDRLVVYMYDRMTTSLATPINASGHKFVRCLEGDSAYIIVVQGVLWYLWVTMYNASPSSMNPMSQWYLLKDILTWLFREGLN
jgi:hypothetical protein